MYDLYDEQERPGDWDRVTETWAESIKLKGNKERKKTDSCILLDSRQDVQKSGKEPMKVRNYKKKHISRNAKNYSLCFKKKKNHYWVIWVRKRKEWVRSCDCTGCLLMSPILEFECERCCRLRHLVLLACEHASATHVCILHMAKGCTWPCIYWAVTMCQDKVLDPFGTIYSSSLGLAKKVSLSTLLSATGVQKC